MQKAIDVYCELRKQRIKVGRLTKNERFWSFIYDKRWIVHRSGFELGPDIPLSDKEYQSKTLFDSFASRIPPRSSANYQRYCEERGISPDERDEMILLGTIGHKAASSFVFELTEDESTIVKQRLKSLRSIITYRGLADLFGISVGSLQHIMAGELRGPGYQLIEMCLLNKGSFHFKLKRAHGLMDETRLELKRWADQIWSTES